MTNDDNVLSFKYKSNIIGNTKNNETKNGVKMAVPFGGISIVSFTTTIG